MPLGTSYLVPITPLRAADYYTNGIAVNNSWKVHNVAKNKWFVLVAGSAEEKQSWMDAIRKEKEKRKRELYSYRFRHSFA